MLPPQDLQQSLAQNDVQLTTGQSGNARAVFAQGGGPGVQPTLAETEHEHFRQVKRRVVYTAIALAALVLLDHIIVYIFNIAEFESAINDIREVVPNKKLLRVLPDTSAIIVGGIPKLIFGILLSLLVPACGWLGAKQGSPKLMGCFCCCNLLCACCGAVGVLVCTSLLGTITSVDPLIENWLDDCDPTQCTSPALGLSKNQTIDCLAAPAPGYHIKYDGQIPHLQPEKCAPIFLTCKVDPEWTAFCAGQMDQHSCAGAAGKCVWMDLDRDSASCIPADQSAIAGKIFAPMHYHPGRTLMARGFMARDGYGYGNGGYGGGYHSGFGSPDGYGRRPVAVAASADPKHNPLELPKDPQADCEVDNKRVETWVAVKELVPELVPMVKACVMVRLLFMVPAVAIGCLGFWWGKDLFEKLNAGYATVSAPPYAGQSSWVQPPRQNIPGHGAPAPYAVMLQPMPVTGVPVPQGDGSASPAQPGMAVPMNNVQAPGSGI